MADNRLSSVSEPSGSIAVDAVKDAVLKWLMDSKPLFVSIATASELLGFGPELTRELVRSGKLASQAVGKRNRKISVFAIIDFASKL